MFKNQTSKCKRLVNNLVDPVCALVEGLKKSNIIVRTPTLIKLQSGMIIVIVSHDFFLFQSCHYNGEPSIFLLQNFLLHKI